MARSGRSSRFTVVVLVLVCITLITIDSRANGGGALHAARAKARDALLPAEGGLTKVVNPIADTVDGLFDGANLRAENRRLRDENDRLRGQIDAGADARRELRSLLEANKLDYAGDLPRVAARVVNTAPSNLSLTVEIDRGTDDGVAIGLPIVTGAGLVGRVESASGRRAQVRLLTDPNLYVGVRLGDSNSQVVVRGQGIDKPLTLDLVKRGTTVAVDEIIVTSGLQGSRYPRGIPVGRVATFDPRPETAYEAVDVTPTVDFNRLEYVFVLLVKGGEDPNPTTTTTTTSPPTTSSSSTPTSTPPAAGAQTTRTSVR